MRKAARLYIAIIICISTIAYTYYCPGLNSDLYNQILLHPSKCGDSAYMLATIGGIKGKEVFFLNEKNPSNPQLNGWIYLKPSSKFIVLFNHGNTGNITYRLWKTKAIIESGTSLFIYDYRGFGRSDGKATLSGIYQDAETAYDYLIELGFKPESIIVYGESVGCAVSCRLAQNRPVAGLILQSPFISLSSLCREQVKILGLYPDPFFGQDYFDIESFLKATKIKKLLIACQKDDVIPFKESRKVFESALCPKTFVLLPQSSHNDFTADRDLFIQSISDFSSLLGRNRN